MRHISDVLIQQYLDTPDLTDRTQVESHLKVCFECQEKLEQYQELYRHLAVECEAVPDESLNASVLAVVGRIESKKNSRFQLQIAGTLSSVMLLALSLNYFGLFSWPQLVEPVKSTLANMFSPINYAVGLLVEKQNGNLELLTFAGLVLILFHFLDYSLLKLRTNRA